MAIRNVQVPMYQARIPIGGGGGYGGNIDLTNQYAPIAEAIEYIIEMKRQKEQDELTRQMTEANIALRGAQTEALGRPKQPSMKIQIGGDGNTYTINPITGEATPVLMPDGKPLPGPKGKASTNLLNAWLKLGGYKEPTPREESIRGALGQEILGERGLEEVEIPSEKRSRLGMDWLARDIPARKEIRKKPTPITEALEKTEPKEKEPATAEEFEAEVARLKKIDMKAAKAYYNKWVRLFR